MFVIANQDAPDSGDLCLRCHTPGGWMEGRSLDTSGAMLNAKDRQGVQCDFCHRAVDYDYVPGVSPAQDVDVLAEMADAVSADYRGSLERLAAMADEAFTTLASV